MNRVLTFVIFYNFKEMHARYRFPVTNVDYCPTTIDSRNSAADRLKCPLDQNKNPSYFCVPNQEKTTLLEFCYDEFLGLVQNGFCLHLSTSGYLNQEECHFFIDGCPTSYYLSNNIYQYPRCQQIDKDNNCFLADPACISSFSTRTPTSAFESYTPNTTIVPNILLNSSSSTTNPPTSEGEYGIPIGLVVGILCFLAVIALVLLVFFVFYKKWWQKRKREFEPSIEEMGLMSHDKENKRRHSQDGKTHWPHHQFTHPDIEVQEEGKNLHIRVTTHLPPDDDIIRWQKDGVDIDCLRDSEKYLSICHGKDVEDRHIYLYVYNTTKEDSGLYTAIWKEDEEEHKRDIVFTKDERSAAHRKHRDNRKVYEVLVRQYGNDLRIRVTTTYTPVDVKWYKDDKEINVSNNANKYMCQSEVDRDKHYLFLYIFQLTLEDSGSYHASWEEEKTGNTIEIHKTKIHFEAVKLIGPNMKVEKDKTQSEKVHKMDNIIFPIFPVNRTYNLVIIEKEESAEVFTNVNLEIFGQFEDDDVRRLLHFGILLSNRGKISWNNVAHISLLDDIRKLMKHKHLISVDEYKTIASDLSGRSLNVDEEGVSFLNMDVELQTVWALMQNHNTFETIMWLFKTQRGDVVQNYFRTPDYERQKDETCVVLCDMLCENFRVFLIEKYIRESDAQTLSEKEKYDLLQMKKEGYKFNQRQSTLLQCAVYYSFMAGENTPKCLAKYFRSNGYESKENEMCICLPLEYNEELIQKLDIDILTHSTFSDTLIHKDICKYLHIPEEVLKWTEEGRQRYVVNFKAGNIKMHRARGMIVGCAGSGKTTLLNHLQRRNRKDNLKCTPTTIGLEVHDNIFLVEDNTLQDYIPDNVSQRQKETDGYQVNLHEGKKLLSMTDFAGQVAYYACHQIYLSRRAFYLLVVDMSKDLEEKPYLKERHNPLGSLFENWTYEAYFVFWLQSIRTYCDDEELKKKYGDKAGVNPVILIASHHDLVKSMKEKKSMSSSQNVWFYDKLEHCLPKEQTLKDHLSPKRYFETECPKGKLRRHQAETIEEVRKCIAETATSLPQWGEKIPVKWSIFEQFVWANKDKRILERKDLVELSEFQSLSDHDINDMLRFYHEIGQIIYFLDEDLRDTIILDVQWFVDAFKNIITDPTHARPFCKKVKEWEMFMKTGRISDSTLCEVWRKNKNESYITHKDKIMPYMEKLGILAKVWTPELEKIKSSHVSPGNEMEFVYYIPSINKTDFTEKVKAVINDGNKTPILIFYFKTYLPHFFFYRLVVRCFSKWEALSDNLFCKNTAFYMAEGGDHNIAIAVNKSSLQLQVFSPDTKILLSVDKTREIRKHVENIIMELTQTFHQQVGYETGYACKDIGLTDEDEDYFLNEETVAKLETNERVCLNFYKENHEKHNIDRDNLLQYWHKS
ncbi:uncharacterized protein LOC133198150 [Saccostrea echinata]|uniref:uncharacterized protein LOC133198150 n=1 Tax=Saccostrea echinata TaxID=191078 RepID=UPI002A8116F7|nr:uncharacterized protein LOC133198150 [Saccostrea echinata]